MDQTNITTQDIRLTITKDKKAKASRSYTLCLAVFILMMALFLAMAIEQLAETSRFGSLFPLAENLEGGTAVPADVVARYAARTDAIVAENYCRSDILMAGASVVLSNLDRQNQSTDYDGWVDAMTRGDRYFEHAISCLPTNGNFWVRLAMIRKAVAERPAEIVALMGESVRQTPADQDVLIARYYMWNRVSPETLAAAHELVAHDLTTALQFGTPFELVPVVNSVGKNLAPYLRDAVKTLSPDRIAQFHRYGVDFDKILAAKSR
jgi:hypothetical protein